MAPAARVCAVVGCPADAVAGDPRCPTHGGTSGPFKHSTHGGRDQMNPWLRATVLARDSYRCYKCGRLATEVDHLVPVSDGGRTVLGNLAAICHRCHVRKSGAEGGRVSRRL